MLFTCYPLLLWLVEPRVKVQVESCTSLLRLFTSAAHGLFNLLQNWFLSGQAAFSRYWWSRRSNAQNLCYHLATGVPTAIQNFLTGVPTCMLTDVPSHCSQYYTIVAGCPRVCLGSKCSLWIDFDRRTFSYFDVLTF